MDEAKQIRDVRVNSLDGRLPYLVLLCRGDSSVPSVYAWPCTVHAEAGAPVTKQQDEWEHTAFDEGTLGALWASRPSFSGMVSSHKGIAVTLALITIPCTSYLSSFWSSRFSSLQQPEGLFSMTNSRGTRGWVCVKVTESLQRGPERPAWFGKRICSAWFSPSDATLQMLLHQKERDPSTSVSIRAPRKLIEHSPFSQSRRQQ